MATPHRVALCALMCFFTDPPEEALFQLPQAARLQLGAFLAREAASADGVREPALSLLLARLQAALGPASVPLAQARRSARATARIVACGRQNQEASERFALRTLMPRFALTCAPLRRAQYVVRTLEGFICVDDLHSFINRLPNVRPCQPLHDAACAAF
jgi:hypothetical protein